MYLLCYVTFNSQGHIATGSLRVEETSAYCTVNHRALVSNYQLSNMKRPAQDSNQRPQRLEVRTLTTTPPSPRIKAEKQKLIFFFNFCMDMDKLLTKKCFLLYSINPTFYFYMIKSIIQIYIKSHTEEYRFY